MATTTNQIAAPQHFSLDQMSSVLMDRKAAPVGCFVSKKLWDNLERRWRHEGNGALGPAPVTFHGIKIAIDPAMPDTEFDAVLTDEAWAKRIREINRPA